jgi:dsDNA-binding SOS-regulon protein
MKTLEELLEKTRLEYKKDQKEFLAIILRKDTNKFVGSLKTNAINEEDARNVFKFIVGDENETYIFAIFYSSSIINLCEKRKPYKLN